MSTQIMVCAVCGYVLYTVEVPGEPVTYRHGLDRADDHPIVPVTRREMPDFNGLCDFCSDPNPTWQVRALDFIVIDVPYIERHGSNGDWAACDDCKELIAADRWGALVRRNVASGDAKGLWSSKIPPVERRQIIWQLYQGLRRHLLDPRIIPLIEVGR